MSLLSDTVEVVLARLIAEEAVEIAPGSEGRILQHCVAELSNTKPGAQLVDTLVRALLGCARSLGLGVAACARRRARPAAAPLPRRTAGAEHTWEARRGGEERWRGEAPRDAHNWRVAGCGACGACGGSQRKLSPGCYRIHVIIV